MKTHKDLQVWENGIKLVENIYAITKGFPPEEKFGLVSQLRRAAVSIPTNIAEGATRKSKTEFTQYLYVALGSTSEIETLMIIAKRIGYLVDIQEILSQNENVRKLLFGLLKSLN